MVMAAIARTYARRVGSTPTNRFVRITLSYPVSAKINSYCDWKWIGKVNKDLKFVDASLVASWECVVTETDGDFVYCDAHPLGKDSDGEREFWMVEVAGHKWTEGHAFYVLRQARKQP